MLFKDKPVIAVNSLRKCYGDKIILDNISFEVRKGEIVGLLGRNGAGKTTILKSILGIKSYESGDIFYNNVSLKNNPNLVNEFGSLIECSFLDYVTAEENIKLLLMANDRFNNKNIKEMIDNSFKLVGLENAKKLKTNQYSFGMKQRLGLIQAILFGKQFMMLDEPFVGLDPIGKDIIKNEIINKAKNKNGCVLFSSHDLADVEEICDRVIMINKGKCIYNGPISKGKVYDFKIVEFNDEIKKQLLYKFKNINISKENIISVSEESVNDILKYIFINNMKIEDLSINNSKLIKLFKEIDK